MKKNITSKSSTENAKFAEVSKFLKLVSDENRLKILLTLGEGTMNVTDIHSKLKLPQNLTSHHISKLKSLELLNEKREGTFRHYSVNAKKLKELNKLFRELLNI
ncbi:MAG: Transcription regulator ArsR [Candidatus Moranbacteria bacterium GW2011_GWC2_37_8]|nr:MAG: Transcription regulator ArsR [Candidatus Moranbacteria bacterium GW2011_GWC2_37_8]KKQ61090.1 MAG: Transcription regulator ArsR [Parcubacteria group bacterium GW2011_GWC1_38_22]